MLSPRTFDQLDPTVPSILAIDLAVPSIAS
jgi:hypothetical protein